MLTGVANFFKPNFGKEGATPRRGSRTARSMMGMFAFVIVAEVLLTLISLVTGWLNLPLMQPIVPGVSWLNWQLVIFAVLILGLWIVFNQMGWFPKPEPLPASARGSTSSANGKKTVTQIPGIGGPKVRAPKPVVRAPIASAATPTKPSFFSRLTGSASKTSAKAEPAATSVASVSGEYDEAYERVKAAQRLKRRRSLR